MEDLGAGRRCRLGVEVGGQLLDVDVDRGHGRLGLLERVRGDGRDPVADEADDIPADDRPIAGAGGRTGMPPILADQDGMDAGHRLRAGGVDGADPAVRDVAVKERGPEHPGHRPVAGVVVRGR